LLQSPSYLFVLSGAVVSAFGGVISPAVLAHVDALGRGWDINNVPGLRGSDA